ncbi:hypothetical protein PIROE2DRAFT_9138 [Piromyces sp. E2]|nr:hypothetical protein PIROE2DRAFT_9138 [Piromyces sp. E2]|eukprot:OUM64170.1 hypothetical protein PIROE2DRAFT_9138 [Piromyces sp. E2]
MSSVSLIYRDEAFVPVELSNIEESESSKKNMKKSNSKDSLTSLKKNSSKIKKGDKKSKHLHKKTEESLASNIEKSLSNKKNNNNNNNNNNNSNVSSTQKVMNCLDNSSIFDILEGITTSLENITNKNPPGKSSYLIQQISSNKLNKELEKKSNSKKSKKQLKKEEKQSKHNKKNSTTSVSSKKNEKDIVRSSSHHSVPTLSRDNSRTYPESVSKTNPNNNEDKKKTNNDNDESRSILNMIKNNSRTNSFSNYSLTKVDENTPAASEKSKKKELKTELNELKKEISEINELEPITDTEINEEAEKEQKLSSLNDSIISLLDSINNATSLRSSEDNINSRLSLSFLNDSSRSFDFTTFMNNKEKEMEEKNEKKNSKEKLKDTEDINPFFLLNPELLESSFSEESMPQIENIKVENSFINEKENNDEKEKDNEPAQKNEEEKENDIIEKDKEKEDQTENNNKAEETEISEYTDTDLSYFKKLEIPKDDKNLFLELAFFNSFNKTNDKKENEEDTEISNASIANDKKYKDIEHINIPLDKDIKRAGINMTYLHKKEKPVIPERAHSFNDANKAKEMNKDELKFYKQFYMNNKNGPSMYRNDMTEELSEGLPPKIQMNTRDIPPYPENYGKNNRRLRHGGSDLKAKHNKQVKVISPNITEIEDFPVHNKKIKIDNENDQDQSEISSATTSSYNSYQDGDDSERHLKRKEKVSIFDSLKILSDSESLVNLKINNKKSKENVTTNNNGENLSTKNRNFIFTNDQNEKIPVKTSIKRELESSSNSLDMINNANIKFKFGLFNDNNNVKSNAATNNSPVVNNQENTNNESVASIFKSKENSVDSLINPKQKENGSTDDPEIFKYGMDVRDVKNDIKEILNSNYKLDKGTFGTIYVGFLNNVKQPIAVKEIKFIEPVEKKTILREVSKLKKWEHPNLIKYHGCLIKKNIIWLMMDYSSEFSLLRLMNLIGETFTEIETKAVMATLVSAFSFLHSKNIVHRNIKCSNIFVSGDGVLKNW